MIATRYAAVTAVALGLALIPTTIHTYMGDTLDDGVRAEAISPELAGRSGVEAKRRIDWVEWRFDSRDFVERHFGDQTLFAVRSYDGKRLYHHPELAVAYGDSYGPETLERLSVRPDVPVHVLRTLGDTKPGLSVYVLSYDGSPIANPLMQQLRISFQLLFSRRKPMTLLFVRDPSSPAGSRLDGSAAAALLIAALDSFNAAAARR